MPDSKKPGHPMPASAVFTCFPKLPTELRIKIWEEAVQHVDRRRRVVNMFLPPVKQHKPVIARGAPILLLLNEEHLRNSDMLASLLVTNTESRGVALRYLARRPPQDPFPPFIERQMSLDFAGDWRPFCRRLRYLSEGLSVHPARDAVFINGIDWHPQSPKGDQTSMCLLPDAIPPLGVPRLWRPWLVGIHGRTILPPEHGFISRFRTIIMPAHGLIDHRDGKALLGDPTFDYLVRFLPPPRLPGDDSDPEAVFIAIVGTPYRGRNLQMEDLEFIPDDEVQRIYEDACNSLKLVKPPPPQTKQQRAVSSALHRDVLLMTAVWEEWKLRAEQIHREPLVWGPEKLKNYGWNDPEQRVFPKCHKLQFARIKQEALERVRAEEVFPTKTEETTWSQWLREQEEEEERWRNFALRGGK
jgi:hypothetical protein